MKEILELVNKNIELEETLQNLKDNSTTIIEKSLTEKFNLLGRMLMPYKEIMKQMKIPCITLLLYSQQLERNINITIKSGVIDHWLQISFYSCSEYSLFNIKSIDKIYWIKNPVLQEISLEAIVNNIRKEIIQRIKMSNKSLETNINQIKTSLKACNIEMDVKLFEAMLNDLFELNNQYIASQDKKLIPFISNIITAMEET